MDGAESFDFSPGDKRGEGGVQSAVETASAEVNTNPTAAQVEAGNYRKGHVVIGEFDITIENPAGSVRKGVDASGKEWSTTMANTYGYIKGTEGVDGDHIDVFLHRDMDEWNGRKVYVVDQTNTDGTFDEHKVMLGFNDRDEAMGAYLANYDATWEQTHPGIRISETSIEDFNRWVEASHRKTKPFADYSTVRKKTEELDAGGRTVEVQMDAQGNPVDVDGKLIVEAVKSVSEISDDDFINPTRTVGLPELPAIVSDALGAEGRKAIIKRNIFNKNRTSHKDLTPEDSRKILNEVLYNPDLYGQNQKETRPYNWILVHLADKNSSVIVEVNPTKENLEIVNWHYLSGETLERKKRQAIKEGGRILTLSEDNAVADTHDGLSSEGKDSTLFGDTQAGDPNNGVNQDRPDMPNEADRLIGAVPRGGRGPCGDK